MKYCLLEDSDRNRFAPFTLHRPVDTLRMGYSTIYEKWKKELAVPFISRSVPFPLSIAWQTEIGESERYINARVLPSSSLIEQINDLAESERLVSEKGDILAIHPKEKTSTFTPIDEISFTKERIFASDLVVISHVWELMQCNGAEIVRDFKRFEFFDNREQCTFPTVHISGDHPVFIHPSAKIEPGVFLMSENGPIIIDAHAHIMAGNLIKGPVSIGEHAILKMGGCIYGETSIGPYCHIGGEVKASIFHSFSNKAHSGYVGNAIVGEWCNWGANTSCSNLKNTYGHVKIARFPNGETQDSGLQFLGVLMGDHTKTAINTSINTGSVFGLMCNIAVCSFPPKFLPSFTWILDDKVEKYSIDKAIETIRHIMWRRKIELSKQEEALLRHIYTE